MNLELIDKTALVSGSTKGIGFAIAGQLAAEGARVIVNGRSDPAVSSALEQIQKAVPRGESRGICRRPGHSRSHRRSTQAFSRGRHSGQQPRNL